MDRRQHPLILLRFFVAVMTARATMQPCLLPLVELIGPLEWRDHGEGDQTVSRHPRAAGGQLAWSGRIDALPLPAALEHWTAMLQLLKWSDGDEKQSAAELVAAAEGKGS